MNKPLILQKDVYLAAVDESPIIGFWRIEKYKPGEMYAMGYDGSFMMQAYDRSNVIMIKKGTPLSVTKAVWQLTGLGPEEIVWGEIFITDFNENRPFFYRSVTTIDDYLKRAPWESDEVPEKRKIRRYGTRYLGLE